jgi:hypothetical protein
MVSFNTLKRKPRLDSAHERDLISYENKQYSEFVEEALKEASNEK